MASDKKNGTRDYAVRVRVNEDELAFLKAVASAEERSVSSVLRLALRDYYEKHAAKAAA